MITQEQLKEHLFYDPETGIFTWLKHQSNFSKIGKPAGCVRKRSRVCAYLSATINYKHYYLHRLAWLYVYGEWPKNCIDHIDGNGLNNSICNLRDVTKKQNNMNSSLRIDNKSGHPGIFYSKYMKKWCAQIRIDGAAKHLGYFSSIEEAVSCRKEISNSLGFHENHGKNLKEFKL